MFYEKEKGTFDVLYAFTSRNPQTTLNIILETGESFQAKFDTDFETDNGLEIGENGYEEYHAMLVRRLDNGELYEINYKNFPREITSNGIVIYKSRA